VLPSVTTTAIAADVIHAVSTADVGIAIEIVIAVNVDIAASPTASPAPTATPCSAHRQTNTKRDCACSNHSSS
jgi:hypothetical protein